MFGYRTDDELHSPAADMLQVLDAAGCDTRDERQLQMGAVAYNTALLVCRHSSRKPSVQPAHKARAGRNERCPCGSGKKYKKCCLDIDRALIADNEVLIKFGAETVPRLWDDDAEYADCQRLSRIMDRDPAFASVGFSPEKVAVFMATVLDQDSSFAAHGDKESRERAFDDLAVRYMRESGEHVTRGIRNKFLAAAARAQSADEARALATGICLALVAETTKDPADDLVGIMLFRKALSAAAGAMSVLGKVLGRLGADKDELRRLIEANDPSVAEKIKSVADELSASELDFLHASFDASSRNLFDTIAAGEFPVPLPFASQLALLGRIHAVPGDDSDSLEELADVIIAFSEELIQDDYVMYGKILDEWLKESTERPNRIMEAVATMRQLCAIRSIDDVAPRLFVHCFHKKIVAPFDEEEQNLIKGMGGVEDRSAFIVTYASWLRAKGYHGMADRLVGAWEGVDILRGERPEIQRRIA